MNSLWKHAVRFLLDEEGPTAVEYALLLLLILLVCLSAITLVGQSTAGSFDSSRQSIEGAVR